MILRYRLSSLDYFPVLGGINFDVRVPLLTFLAMLGLYIYQDLVCGSLVSPWNLLCPEIQIFDSVGVGLLSATAFAGISVLGTSLMLGLSGRKILISCNNQSVDMYYKG